MFNVTPIGRSIQQKSLGEFKPINSRSPIILIRSPMTIDMSRYAAMEPFFKVVTSELKEYVDGDNFFDMHAEDVVIEYVIAVPDSPLKVVGRKSLAILYRDYGLAIVQTGSSDVRTYYDPRKSVAVLEYTIQGNVVNSGAPYLDRFISVARIKDRKIAHWRDYLDPLAAFAVFRDQAPPGFHHRKASMPRMTPRINIRWLHER
jgi:uncharacterized protein